MTHTCVLQMHQGLDVTKNEGISSFEYSIDLLGAACSGRGACVAQWETLRPLLTQAAWFLQHTRVSSQ